MRRHGDGRVGLFVHAHLVPVDSPLLLVYTDLYTEERPFSFFSPMCVCVCVMRPDGQQPSRSHLPRRPRGFSVPAKPDRPRPHALVFPIRQVQHRPGMDVIPPPTVHAWRLAQPPFFPSFLCRLGGALLGLHNTQHCFCQLTLEASGNVNLIVTRDD